MSSRTGKREDGNIRAYDYRKIDAFTAEKSLGNPAACIYLGAGQTLTDAEMLLIAMQHKGFVSEVVFCTPKPPSGFGLTFFSSECEVAFCGHGTIACLYALIQESPALMCQKEIAIDTSKKGALTVYNEIAEQDAVYITAPTPKHLGFERTPAEIAANLSLEMHQIATFLPIDRIDAGLRTLIVPIATLQDEIHLFPNEQRLKSFCINNDIDIVLVFSLETDKPDHIAHTRVFAPRFGYLEDPATGSGNSAFGYYMRKNNLWSGAPATVEQGGVDRVFNTICLSCKGEHVLFGGRATTRIQGVYFL